MRKTTPTSTKIRASTQTSTLTDNNPKVLIKTLTLNEENRVKTLGFYFNQIFDLQLVKNLTSGVKILDFFFNKYITYKYWLEQKGIICEK